MLTTSISSPYVTASRQNRRRKTKLSAIFRSEQPQNQQKRIEYKDSWTDIAFIGLCRLAYANLSGWQSPRSFTDGAETFTGMVEVSRSLMKGRTATQQRDAVIAGFPQIPPWFRKVFPYSRWGAELNARITPAFFTWLVGPMETIEVDIRVIQDGNNPSSSSTNSTTVRQRSGVRIERCRYLAESNCVGMCVNLCKSPVQTFFTEQLGMPLTMEPNFEDYSCTMTFGGQLPPPVDKDPLLQQQPCLELCATARRSSGGGNVCYKLLD